MRVADSNVEWTRTEGAEVAARVYQSVLNPVLAQSGHGLIDSETFCNAPEIEADSRLPKPDSFLGK